MMHEAPPSPESVENLAFVIGTILIFSGCLTNNGELIVGGLVALMGYLVSKKLELR